VRSRKRRTTLRCRDDISARHAAPFPRNGWHGRCSDSATAGFVTREFTIGEFMPGNEIAECRWFALDALPHELSPATRQRLAELEPGAPPVADSW